MGQKGRLTYCVGQNNALPLKRSHSDEQEQCCQYQHYISEALCLYRVDCCMLSALFRHIFPLGACRGHTRCITLNHNKKKCMIRDESSSRMRPRVSDRKSSRSHAWSASQQFNRIVLCSKDYLWLIPIICLPRHLCQERSNMAEFIIIVLFVKSTCSCQQQINSWKHIFFNTTRVEWSK